MSCLLTSVFEFWFVTVSTIYFRTFVSSMGTIVNVMME